MSSILIHSLAGLFLFRLERFVERGAASDPSALLCAILRRFPCWCGGHLRLAELRLTHGHLLACHCELAAAEQCARGAADRRTLAALRGALMLRTGDAAAAVATLEPLLTQRAVRPYYVHEELAAAYGLVDRDADAAATIEAIPEKHRSPGAIAALKHHRGKLGANRAS